MTRPRPADAIFLVNCTACDDIFRANPDRIRACVCGKSTFTEREGRILPSGRQCRILRIDWEQYDGAIVGELRRWEIEHDR